MSGCSREVARVEELGGKERERFDPAMMVIGVCKNPNPLSETATGKQTCKMWGGSLCALKQREATGVCDKIRIF